MTQRYDNLTVTSLTPEQHQRTCNYWYVVQHSWGPHTAFTTRAGLNRWLSERGLKIDDSALPNTATHANVHVQGEYATQMHSSYDEFYNLPNVVLESKTLSNGDYTLARITQDENGIRTEHTLNPNCRNRPVFDYFKTAEEMK